MRIQVKKGQRFYLPEHPGTFITGERGAHDVPPDFEVEYLRAIRRGTIEAYAETPRKGGKQS